MKYRLFISMAALMLPLTSHAEYPWDLLNRPNFRPAYLKAIGSSRTEPWVFELSGPSEKVVEQQIKNQNYLFASSCKHHWCNTSNLVLAYNLGSKRVFVKLMENGKVRWFGAPSPEIQTSLEKFYETRFGKK